MHVPSLVVDAGDVSYQPSEAFTISMTGEWII